MSEHRFTVYYMGRWQAEDLTDTRAALEEVGANLELLNSMHDEDEIISHVRDADGIITSESPMTRKVLESLTQCKVVLRTGVGYDVIDVEAATEQGIAVVERRITRDEFYIADEAFFTGTAAEVLPIRELDGRTIGEGTRGPLTGRLQALYFDQVRGRREAHPEWHTAVAR